RARARAAARACADSPARDLFGSGTEPDVEERTHRRRRDDVMHRARASAVHGVDPGASAARSPKRARTPHGRKIVFEKQAHRSPRIERRGNGVDTLFPEDAGKMVAGTIFLRERNGYANSRARSNELM